ncbi:MAG TPA: amino acid adenylation domain-containing protein, partial [Ruminiclostridium sp.]|nr:amino acid adenylation domain-containing protein [Ruminiclostridium sp.]
MKQEEFFPSECKDAKVYWEDKLSGELSEAMLPFDYIKAPDNARGTFHFELSRELSDELSISTDGKDIDIFIMLTAALNILLYKYTGQNDILVGIPAIKEFCQYNKLIIQRSNVQGKMTVREYLRGITQEITSCYKNQQYPMEELIRDLKLDNTSLFRVISIYENIHNYEKEDEILCSVKNDIAFCFSKPGDTFKACITYNSSLFKAESIYQLHKCYLNILGQILLNRDTAIANIELVTPEERQKIIEVFNNTKVEFHGQNFTIQKIFELQARSTPDNIAVSCVSERNGKCASRDITYRELNEKSNRLARTLRKNGVKQDTIVAIMPRRSIEMVVGILAVLKAGGAYLPIDPDYPQNRINLILEDCGTGLLLTHNDMGKKIQFKGIIMDIENEEMYDIEKDNLEGVSKPEDLACVIYTSGSTGKPKGVLVEHKNMVNFVNWRIGNYGYTDKDVSLQLLSVAFDGFGSIFYSSLLSGGTLIIIDEQNKMDFDFLRSVLKDRGVTNLCLVPSMYKAILEGAKTGQLETIRFITLAGEKADECLIDLSNSINPHILLSNEYGPTENTIATTSYTGMTRDKTSVIGKPISNHKVFIVNKDLNLMPVGVPGELCVTGTGVTRGYLKRPQLTSEKFITIPSIAADNNFYMTGDLARWQDDGNIEFMGRVDHQIKVRGFRIELGEIENSLLSYEPVKECIVSVNEDKQGSRYICAYVVSERELTAVELRDYLSELLPEYMIPSQFIKLDRLPLMQNGKADRNALAQYNESMEMGVEYSAPKSVYEEKLTGIWQEVLELPKIGVNDRFFDIGGDSIKAVKISELCLKHGMKISATD